jgi:hypothetical protein
VEIHTMGCSQQVVAHYVGGGGFHFYVKRAHPVGGDTPLIGFAVVPGEDSPRDLRPSRNELEKGTWAFQVAMARDPEFEPQDLKELVEELFPAEQSAVMPTSGLVLEPATA